MNNMQYEGLLRAKLIDMGIDSVYLDAYVSSIVEHANDMNINLMELIENGITKELLGSPKFAGLINDVRNNTSFVYMRKFKPQPNKFVKRNVVI